MKEIGFISGKITGDENYIQKFNEAEEMIEKELGIEVINPACLRLPESCTWQDYMDLTLTMLDKAGAIILLPDWRDSPEACVEYGYSIAHEKKVLRYEHIIKPKEIKKERICKKCGKTITGRGNKHTCDECKALESDQPE